MRTQTVASEAVAEVLPAFSLAPACSRKTMRLTVVIMADTITIRTDEETERALEVLTHGGVSRSSAIRQAVLEAAARRERAAQMRREALRMNLGQPDGINVAEELARERAGER
jgi:Arc/MetJ-type ribon-helix-helix transcriptional regulator